MTRTRSIPALLLAATLAAACKDSPNVTDCSMVDPVPNGILATVRDSVTDASAAFEAKLKVVSGTYADSATGTSQSVNLLAAGKQAGSYTVTVTKAGYATWTRANVDVGQWA